MVSGLIRSRERESSTFDHNESNENGQRFCERQVSKTIQTNMNLTKQSREIPIKNRTKKGYLMASDGDGIDILPRMIYHRGTVQKGMSQTIKTSCDVGVIEIK